MVSVEEKAWQKTLSGGDQGDEHKRTIDEVFKQIKSEQNPKGNNVIGLDRKPVKTKKLNSKYVFTYEGEPVKEVKKSFKTALRDAEIQDFRFHDLRHTFASQVIMRGGTLKDVQELLGHKTMTMTLRYAHLTQEHKRKAVNLLNGLTAPKNGNCHKSVTSANVTISATT